MNDFVGIEELLGDFLLEAPHLLSEVDSNLMVLEKSPENKDLLNKVFRGFHTIKGGAGFLQAKNLIDICHLTESLFDKLRNGEMFLSPSLLDVILSATGEVREMFADMASNKMPRQAPQSIIDELNAALNMGNEKRGDEDVLEREFDAIVAAQKNQSTEVVRPADLSGTPAGVDIDRLQKSAFGRRSSDVPGSASPAPSRRDGEAVKDATIRVDTERLDQVLNLSGEIGLTKNRLTHLRNDIVHGKTDAETIRALDESVSQLDMLVVNLQNAVMNTRMQPISRLFKKYPRLARDLARQLGKDVELELSGEETEIDKTMIEDLNDPLVHLVRNAVDHGVESPEQRSLSGKPSKSTVHLGAKQEGDHILISISDDGVGMRPDVIRSKAIEKGLISLEEASSLDERACLNLIFLPGFSTKDEISSISGRGVGMDVVKTNIAKLNGSITIESEPGRGTTFTVALPLTLAILPVLLLKLKNQSYAVPLSMVREIMFVMPEEQQNVGGKPTMVVRGEVLPVRPLSELIGWNGTSESKVGVLMQVGHQRFILSADSFVGHDDVVIKSLDTFRPKGVAGVTMSSEGDIILILDVKELIGDRA